MWGIFWQDCRPDPLDLLKQMGVENGGNDFLSRSQMSGEQSSGRLLF